jgi:DNA helicase IV
MLNKRVGSLSRPPYHQSLVLDFISKSSQAVSLPKRPLRLPSEESPVNWQSSLLPDSEQEHELVRHKIVEKLVEKRFRANKVLTEQASEESDRLRCKRFERLTQLC